MSPGLVEGETAVPQIKSKRNKQAGFTLVELAIVIVIIGVLAAFGVPRFRDSVERSKAAEAFSYLSSVRAAQERYHGRSGTYADKVTKLDIQLPAPKYFAVEDAIAPNGASLEKGWTLTLTRAGASAGYGAYTVVYTEQGFDTATSTIADEDHANINPVAS
jgi:prepilin-type N-terminal cleavage/methylation domain-containing protein